MALSPLEVLVPTIGDTTRVVAPESQIEIVPNIQYGSQKSGAATNTIARKRRKAVRPIVNGSFLVPYEDDTWFTAFENRTDLALFAQAGNVPGSTVLISCPTIQLSQPTNAPTDEELRGASVPWHGRHDEEIAGATELTYSALRFHCL